MSLTAGSRLQVKRVGVIQVDTVRRTVRDLYKEACVVINPELKAAFLQASKTEPSSQDPGVASPAPALRPKDGRGDALDSSQK